MYKFCFLLLFVIMSSCVNTSDSYKNESYILKLLSSQNVYETEYVGLNLEKSKLYKVGAKLGEYKSAENLLLLLDSNVNNVTKGYAFLSLVKKDPLVAKDKLIDNLVFDESKVIHYSAGNLAYRIQMNMLYYFICIDYMDKDHFVYQDFLDFKEMININNVKFDYPLDDEMFLDIFNSRDIH